MNDAIAPGPGANFSRPDTGEQPTFGGYTRQDFIRDIGHCCTEMVSVATNYQENDDRTVLAARLEAETGNGYLMSVRISHETPRELLLLATALYEAIQEHYHQSIDES